MILRDPVHGLVCFEGQAERVVVALLGTREMQRLRRVRQLGLSALVFPGAEHSRFAHALGAAYVMVRLLDRVRAVHDAVAPEHRLDAEAERDAVAAALLHDVGHGPFSHLFEEVMPSARSHEAWTVDVIEDDATEVHAALRAFDAAMPGRVSGLLRGEHRLGWLARAVSGTLDVDRCDYLLRDSHMTGARYGLFDLDWLLRSLRLECTARGEAVLAVEGRKGLPPIEDFFLGRHFMYRQVYHHKATRAAERLLRAIVVRLAELVAEQRAPEPLPVALGRAARAQPVRLDEYLELDDAALQYSVGCWARDASDALLRDLCARLHARRLFKTVPLPPEPEAAPTRARLRERAEREAAALGLRPDLYVSVDVARDVPYAEPTDERPEGVWVAMRHQPLRRLGDCSFVLGELRNKSFEDARLVVPPEVRDAIADEAPTRSG
ncbi:MAG: HD domain-containing protein [Myxococcota bacterium]|nr:HD domain-containing protein [Myxococcota bacterium]MDW8363330.1 HD domain-containing protein [Myxococcales bacterium]